MKKLILFLISLSHLCAETIEELKYVVRDDLCEIWGWCSEEKAMSFIDLVLEVKPEVCAEIGVFGGASVFPVAMALKHLGRGVIVAIDPWDKLECLRYLSPDKDPKDLRWWAHQNLDHIYFGFLSMLNQYQLQKNCIVFRMISRKAAKAIAMIDILHIDGNHFPDIAVQDVQLYLPKVKKGGYIWFNDASWNTLPPAIQILLNSCDIIKSIDNGNCTLFRKR